MDETEDSNASGETVGTGNDERIARLNAIADQADSERSEDFANVNDDGTTEPFQVESKSSTEQADKEQAEQEPAAATPAEEPVAEKRYKIKVNGKELELTESELIARASKIEAADDYLRRAKERAAPEPELPAGPTPEELQRRQDEEDRALVRAIQMGTEEEAAAALRKLREQASARPSLSRDDVSRTIDERLAFNTAIEKFSSEYADVWTDPILKKIALDRDAQLLTQGDQRTYWDRYSQIGEEIRTWRQSLVPAAAKQEDPALAEKEQRKASAPKVPVAASAKTKPVKVEEDEIDDAPSSVIANMAKSRGGPQWMRG